MSAERQTNSDFPQQDTVLEQQLNRRGLLRLGAAAVVASVLPKVPESDISRQLGSSSEARETEGFGGGFHAEFRIKKVKKGPLLDIRLYNVGDERFIGANCIFTINDKKAGVIQSFSVRKDIKTNERYLSGRYLIPESFIKAKTLKALIYTTHQPLEQNMLTPLVIRRVSSFPTKLVADCNPYIPGDVSTTLKECGYDAQADLIFRPNSFEGTGYVVFAYSEDSPASNGYDKSKPVWVGITGKLLKPAKLEFVGSFPMAAQLTRFVKNAVDEDFSEPVNQRVNPVFEVTKTGGYRIVKY